MKTVYLDMDDVVADFKGYARAVLRGKEQIDERWAHEDWITLKNNLRLYRDLDKTIEADKLVEFCRQYCKQKNYNLLFLTAVPKGNDVHWAFYDKVLWAVKYFSDIPVMFGPFSKDKQAHCSPGDILIDDRSSNINEWISAGGIGIKHQYGNLDNTIKQLERLND